MNAKYFLRNRIQSICFVLVLIATLLASTAALAAEGTLDPTFGSNGVVVTDLGGPDDIGTQIVLQPDGKIILCGLAELDESNPWYFTPILVRYHPNGTLDTTFGTGGKVPVGIGGLARVALQADGKLIVGGSLHGGLALTRYTANGTLDTTFGINGVVVAGQTENGSLEFVDLAIQPDGKIVVVGTWETYGHHYPAVIARFNENGTLDEGFGVMSLEFPNGLQHYINGVAIQSDGRILMSGSMLTEDEGDGTIALARLTAGVDPWFDPAFGTNGTVITPLDHFQQGRGALALQADGKIVIAGTVFSATNDNVVLARYNSNGTPDTTLGGSGIVITDLGGTEGGHDVAIQGDGKILVVGEVASGSLLLRYNPDGSLDTAFGDAGKVFGDLGGIAVALQPDGKILIAGGRYGDVTLARYVGTPPPTASMTFTSKAAADGWILESGEFTNAGGLTEKNATTVNVGDDPKDKQYRAIISFNTAALPDNAFIVSARVNLKRQGVVGSDPFNTHGSLLLDIRNGLFSNDLDVTLNDFAAPASSSTPDMFAAPVNSWYTATLGSSNLPHVNKYGVTQFRLRFDRDDNDDLRADYLKFFSGDATYGADHPQLIVNYVLP